MGPPRNSPHLKFINKNLKWALKSAWPSQSLLCGSALVSSLSKMAVTICFSSHFKVLTHTPNYRASIHCSQQMIWLHITLTEQMQLIENSPFIPTVIELTSFFPWAQPHFIPVYHYDEGHLLLPGAVSPYADFITALSPLQFRLRVSCIPSFPLFAGSSPSLYKLPC